MDVVYAQRRVVDSTMHWLYQYEEAKAKSAITLFPDVIIGYRIPGDVVITRITGDWAHPTWIAAWKMLVSETHAPMWVQVSAGDDAARHILEPQFKYVGSKVSTHGDIFEWWFRPGMTDYAYDPSGRVHPLVHPAHYYGVSTLDLHGTLPEFPHRQHIPIHGVAKALGLHEGEYTYEYVTIESRGEWATDAGDIDTSKQTFALHIPCMLHSNSTITWATQHNQMRSVYLSSSPVWCIDERWPIGIRNAAHYEVSHLIFRVPMTPALLARLMPV